MTTGRINQVAFLADANARMSLATDPPSLALVWKGCRKVNDGRGNHSVRFVSFRSLDERLDADLRRAWVGHASDRHFPYPRGRATTPWA